MGKKPMELEELKQVELGILKSFHAFCEKNSLRYYLCGGTLIGAIRHKGFIPWDDDIDLMMPRPDFMKLYELVKEDDMLDEFYKVDCSYSNPNALTACIRIYDIRTELTFDNFRMPYTLGCWVDVFPLDGLPDSESKRNMHFKSMRLLKDIYYLSITKFGGKRRSKLVSILQYGLLPILPFTRIPSNAQYTKWLDNVCRKYDYDKCNYVGVLEGRAVEKEAMLKEKMEPAVSVEFEGSHFWAMANYDEYLQNLYGDYMQLPPKEERVSRHEIRTFWKDGKPAE
ncbi:MAG: LicD family protein [Christensenellaceae bacterium]|jgi:lipopolysaccharide cholinephosphotransferase